MSAKLTKYINNIDYCWYDSSNIIFSICHDKLDELKTLYITFNNGGTYIYENVSVTDYILFKHDISQGKVFHKLLKKYDGKKIDVLYDVNKVNKLYENLLKQDENKEEFKKLLTDNTIYEIHHLTMFESENSETINDLITEAYIKKTLYNENSKSINLINHINKLTNE